MMKEKKAKKDGHYPVFWYVCKKMPVQMAAIIVLSIFEAVLPAMQTLLIANCVDHILRLKDTASGQGHMPYLLIILLVFTQFFQIMIPAVNGFIVDMGKRKLDVFLKEMMIQKCGLLEFAYIEDNENKAFIDRVIREPGDRFLTITMNLIGVVRLVITICSILLIILDASVWVGCVMIAICLPFYKIAMKAGKENYSMFQEEEGVKRGYRYLYEVLCGREDAEERNLYGYSDAIRKKLALLYEKTYRIEKKIQERTFINLKSGSIFTLFLAVFIIGLLLPAFLKGTITSGLFIALTTAVLNLVQTMSWELSEAMFSLAASAEYSRELYRFFSMAEKSGAADAPGKRDGLCIETIEFRHVTFRYPNTETDILKDCSFLMKKGAAYAFVGQNGAGKSTIVKLLLGFYDQYSGEILINGKELREYSYCDIKAAFSVVNQNFARYSISIRDNVKLGSTMRTDETKIREVIRKVGLEEKINSLEKGIDTELGYLGKEATELSLGQWQRLILARMMYSNAPVQILDEPTAAVDPVQESNIYKLFQKMSDNTFTIYITHRLGAARIADQILVVANGTVAERGKHEELIKRKGIYYEMYQSQSSWYE